MENRHIETAIFIGADGSMGLRQGKTYQVVLNFVKNRIYATLSEASISIPYDTMSALVKNWEFRKD